MTEDELFEDVKYWKARADAAADEIERLREIITMTDNRLEAATLDGGVCEHCIAVARSYLAGVVGSPRGQNG